MDRQTLKQAFRHARALYKEGNFGQACEMFEELRQQYPNNKDVVYPLACCVGKLGDYDRALELCGVLENELEDPRGPKLRAALEKRRAAAGAGSNGAAEQLFDEEIRAETNARIAELEAALAERDKALEAARREAGMSQQDAGEIPALKQAVADLTTDLDVLRAKKEELSSHAEQLAQELESARADATGQAAALSEAQARAEALQKELDALRTVREPELKTLQEQLENYKQAEEEARSRLEQVRSEADQFRKEAESRQSALDKANQTIDEFKQAIAGRDAQLSETERAYAQRMDAALQDKDALQKKLSAREAEIGRLKDQVAQAQAARETLEAQLREHPPEAWQRLEAEREEVQKRSAALEKERAALEAELDLAQETARTAEDRLEALEDETEALRARLTEFDALDIDQLKQDYERVKRESAALRAELEKLTLAYENVLRPAHTNAREQEERIAKAALDESGRKRRLGTILVDAGVITKEQLDIALKEQQRDRHRSLGHILVEHGFCSEEIIAHTLAHQLKLPFVTLADDHIPAEAVSLISRQLATRHQCIPIRSSPEHVVLAISNPLNLMAVDDVELTSGRRVETVVATVSDITQAIERCYS